MPIDISWPKVHSPVVIGRAGSSELRAINRDFRINDCVRSVMVFSTASARFPASLATHFLVVLLAVPTLTQGASSAPGPSMVIAAAEEAAHADTLIGACEYDDAERWIKEAAKTARDARSNNELERDVAGSAYGQMTVKLKEFQRQRKDWDHAVIEVRHLLDENHLEAAFARLDAAHVPACDPRFIQLRTEIAGRSKQAAELVRKGDAQAVQFPRTAEVYYLQARLIDPDRPGLLQRIQDVERRAPGVCASCAPQRKTQ